MRRVARYSDDCADLHVPPLDGVSQRLQMPSRSGPGRGDVDGTRCLQELLEPVEQVVTAEYVAGHRSKLFTGRGRPRRPERSRRATEPGLRGRAEPVGARRLPTSRRPGRRRRARSHRRRRAHGERSPLAMSRPPIVAGGRCREARPSRTRDHSNRGRRPGSTAGPQADSCPRTASSPFATSRASSMVATIRSLGTRRSVCIASSIEAG